MTRLPSVATLHDADLETVRPTNWGGVAPVRKLLRTLLEHDIYHAGEINQLRAISAADDAWAYEL